MGLLFATTKAGLNSLFVNIQPTATFVHCIHDIPPGKKYDGSPIVSLLYYTSFMGHMPWIKCGSIKETRTVWRAGLSAQGGNELCRRLHPNDSRNPFSFTVVPQGVMAWKEVPRRGGGWRGKAVSPTHSLPLEGKVPRRGG